ncbi:RNA polymerase sigma-70 factor [Parabacteroides faecis]|uniref:RNA polymerase sigma-70 factor n=1 Tax=Parabacteroides TaxID=375288 RepID=UPI000F003B56|nr:MULTISPECIES: RNA polymerase sigma-70 factor [Parabacteroides]MBC8619486.1 RNA polymerase sigma-70 factor [Parabacteroides faecis]RHR97664.1 RNA polymerase sigma-70 factor [Parabacteroides sp. AF14-59]
MGDYLDIEVFNQLFREYKDRFTRFAKTYVYDSDQAEDIVIESFMYYWENRTTLNEGNNIPSYILTVIKHKCLNYLQRLKTRDDIEKYLIQTEEWELQIKIATLEACNPERLFSEEVQHIIDKTLADLPEQTRNIFIMSRYQDKNHREIAEEVGLSTKSIEYHITKTLKLLRDALKDYFPFLLIMYRIFD